MPNPDKEKSTAGKQGASEIIHKNDGANPSSIQGQISLYPFRRSAPILRQMGCSVVPLPPRSKAIIINGWSKYCKVHADDATFNKWLQFPNANIGVCLGSASGIVGLDYDYNISGMHEKIMAIVPTSPVHKKGAKGLTAFYRYSGEKSVSFKIDGKTVLEILSTGRQTVLPPSIHPDTGREYVWLTPDTLETVRANELPELTQEQIKAIHNLFAPYKPQEKIPKNGTASRAQHRHVSSEQGDFDDIIEALGYIPADDHEVWYQVGMALKAHLGEKGYSFYDQWSAKSGKYEGSVKTRAKWDSFNSAGINIGTLFFYAMQYGFRPQGRNAHYRRLYKDAKPSLPAYYPYPRYDVEQVITEQRKVISSWFGVVYGSDT